MAVVTFYEKPGCSGNARQKALLKASGHVVLAKNILETRWTRMQLLAFLESQPVAQWFNRNAPMVKSGEIVPEEFDEETALGLLQNDPVLIRRPLLEVDGVRRAGFEVETIKNWIGLSAASSTDELEVCRHGDNTSQCSGHDGDHCHEPNHALKS